MTHIHTHTYTRTEAGRAEDVSFLSHSLGALELHSHNAAAARAAFAAGLIRSPNNSPLLLGAALAEVKLGEQAYNIYIHTYMRT